MPIYTRTGDKGRTSLFNGQRVSKFDLRVETYGTVDELNSAIGVVLSEIRNPTLRLRSGRESEIRNELERIQSDLLEIGSALANPQNGKWKIENRKLSKRVKEFEDFIDKMTIQMPPLANFILPGGGKTGAFLHLARAVCRRAERRIVELNNKETTDSNIVIYLNRLSDLLFTMARFSNFKEKKKETIWSGRK